jgi:hypothetical protein
MFTVLVVIALLAASVSAIYLLLKSMGQDGIAIAQPGSCKSGQCGVRKDLRGCHQEGEHPDATEEDKLASALDQQAEEEQNSRAR